MSPASRVSSKRGDYAFALWNPKVGIGLSSLEAGAENQTCSSSTPRREGFACLGCGEFLNLSTPTPLVRTRGMAWARPVSLPQACRSLLRERTGHLSHFRGGLWGPGPLASLYCSLETE